MDAPFRKLVASNGFFESLFLAVLPFLLLVIEIPFEHAAPLSPFFLTGSLLEFVLSVLLMFLYNRGALASSTYASSEYLLRTTLGLTVTVYVSLNPVHRFAVFLRLIAVLFFFRKIGYDRGQYWFVFLLFVGLLFFSYLQRFSFPGMSHLFLAISVLMTGILLLLEIGDGRSRKRE